MILYLASKDDVSFFIVDLLYLIFSRKYRICGYFIVLSYFYQLYTNAPLNALGLLFCSFAISLLNRKLQFDSCLLFLTFMCFIAFSVRIGFSEMAIMSGRLSTAFSYAEIFLIPALFEARFSRLVGFSCIVILFLIQLTITIGYQAPYLINDYFNPLYVYS